MSASNYLHCLHCYGKTVYVGENDVDVTHMTFCDFACVYAFVEQHPRVPPVDAETRND